MKTFRLVAVVAVSACTEVRAESLDEAKRVAAKRDVVLGGPGSCADESAEWVIDEADGLAQDIRAEDE